MWYNNDMKKKIWSVLVGVGFLLSVVGQAEAESCLWVIPSYSNSDEPYIGHKCQEPDFLPCNRSTTVFGYELYSNEPYTNSSECEKAYQTAVKSFHNKAGSCYDTKNAVCITATNERCNSLGGGSLGTTYFYEGDSDLSTCKKNHFYTDVYCFNSSTVACERKGEVAKDKATGCYHGSNAEKDCKDANIIEGAYCYKDGECRPMPPLKRMDYLPSYSSYQGEEIETGNTSCEGNGVLYSGSDAKTNCQNNAAASGYCLYKRSSNPDDLICVEQKNTGGSNGQCPENYFEEENTPIYTKVKGPMSKGECDAELSHNKCCIVTDSNGHHSCQCGSSAFDNGRCISGSQTYGPETCENALPSEAVEIEIPGTENLKATELEEINPLKGTKFFPKPGDRTPGKIISRLVRNVVFPISGLVLFLQIVYAGFQIVQGGMMGDDNSVNNGKQRLTATIVGFLLLFGSYWMWSLVEAALGLNATG